MPTATEMGQAEDHDDDRYESGEGTTTPDADPVTTPDESQEHPESDADVTIESASIERDYADMLAGLNADTEIEGWQAEVNMHGKLLLDAKKRLIDAGDKKMALKRAKRGEKSNGGR
jgi:hypothetical protein